MVTAVNSTPSTLSLIVKWAGRGSSLILLIGAVSYAVGFLVVNSYLSHYGIAPFDFLQPRYVSAGLLYLVGTIGVSGFLWGSYDLIRTKYYPDQTYNAERRAAGR